MTLLSAAETPLSSYPLLHATDLDQAQQSVSEVFCTHHLDFADAGRALDMNMNAVRMKYMTFTYLTYGAQVDVVPGVLPGWFAMMIPIRGRSRIRYGREDFVIGRGSAALCSPVRPLDMRWSADCAQVVLRIEYSAMQDILSSALGRLPNRPLEFAPVIQLDGGPMVAWRNVAREIIDDLDRGIDSRWLVDLEQFLMSRLLRGQRHSYTRDMLESQQPAGATVVRRAIDLVEGDLQRSWTLDSLAAEVGVPTWSLQAAFRNDGQVPPMRHLRLARLRRARDGLLRADSRRGDTVADVAGACGFTHLSRFALQYREYYGELPSETLAR